MLSFSPEVNYGGGKKVALGTNFTPCSRAAHLPSVHAEFNGMQKLAKLNNHRRMFKKGNNSDKIDIFVIRISQCGIIGYSRPCKGCIKRMLKFNANVKINNVYYSDSDGTIKVERLVNMYASSLTKLSNGDLRRSLGMGKFKDQK